MNSWKLIVYIFFKQCVKINKKGSYAGDDRTEYYKPH